MIVPEYPLGTKEYVKAIMTSDRSLSAQVVEIKVNGTWVPASWQGSAGLTRTARTTSVVDFASAVVGYQTVFCRFADAPELPIVDCGRIKVTTG